MPVRPIQTPLPLLVWLSLFWFGICTVLSSQPLYGQNQGSDRHVVDVINLKNRKQIRGFVFNPNDNGDVRIAVSRDWLKKNDREQYKSLSEKVKQDDRRARLELQTRLANLNTTGKHPAFRFFISQEKERIDKLVEQPDAEKPVGEESQFLTITIKRALVSNAVPASASNRKIALWAWSERLDKVESRSPKELVAELTNKKLDPSKTPPDLSSRFPPVPETEEQWTMRLAIVEDGLAEKVEFHGTGDVMVRARKDEQAQADIPALLANMMQNQVTSLLDELSGGGKKSPQSETAWLKAAANQAEKLTTNYFRATQVAMDPSAEVARVQSSFMVKLPDGLWKQVWKLEVEELASAQSKESIQQLLDDPQVQSIRDTMKSLGSATGLNDSLENALRFGSATKRAQERLDEEFQQFQSRYLKRLDEPPM